MTTKLPLILLFLLISLGFIYAQRNSSYAWESASNGFIPKNAIVGGHENGKNIYIARASYRGGVHPGKISSGWKGCHIGYGGKEVVVSDYEVMVYSDMKWQNASNGYIPENAVVGGNENGKNLYVCRGWYNGSQHPGKISHGMKGCHIGYGGEEIILNNYEVMINSPSLWERASNGFIPANAVAAGKENGKNLYIARARYRGGVHPGKITEGWDGCHIGYGGKEVSIGDYEVMVAGKLAWEKARNGYIPDNAVAGGYENGKNLYIARAVYKRGIQPGKMTIGWKGIHIGYGGKEIILPVYEVLVYRIAEERSSKNRERTKEKRRKKQN